jgi:NDP-sugar pyrophosphorylase family protein
MKAMILAAGLGSRLHPLTADRTKPAVPFHGRPLVGYVAEYLARQGFTDVVVNLHHQPESVRAALGDGSSFGVQIRYSEEFPELLGTSGALDRARPLLGDGTFITINGKLITNIDLRRALETHRSSGAIATMILKPNVRREKFTEILTYDGRLSGFGGMPASEPGKGDAPLMFTGIQILEPDVFDYVPEGVRSDIVGSFYRPALDAGENIAVHVSEEDWHELSTTRRYLDISLAMSKDESDLIGGDVSVAESAKVSDSVLWNRVTVGAGATLRRVVVGDDVVIPKGAAFEDVVIVRAELVRAAGEPPDKSAAGEFDGENYIVPLT